MISRFVFSVKGPELINMYVGQSEENVREGEIALFILTGAVSSESKEGRTFLLNDALNTFYLRLYGIGSSECVTDKLVVA